MIIAKTRKDTNVHFSNLVRLVVIPAAKWGSVMAEIKQKYSNRVKVVFINVSQKENRNWSTFWNRDDTHTVLLDKKGKEYFRHNGYLSAMIYQNISSKKEKLVMLNCFLYERFGRLDDSSYICDKLNV